MAQPLDILVETPSQTAGPYVHIGCLPSLAGIQGIYQQDLGRSPVAAGAKGRAISISGRVLDGTGWPVRDAMLESWQADAAGLYPGQPGADPHVTGFCRLATDSDNGEFTLQTIKPGAVRNRNGAMMAPHISLWIVARGINIGLHTRIYFDDDDCRADPLIARIEQRSRAETLIATSAGSGSYRFDVRLQGPGETVFLDL